MARHRPRHRSPKSARQRSLVRALAMLLLYQVDQRGWDVVQSIADAWPEGLESEADAPLNLPEDPDTRRQIESEAWRLAKAAWESRGPADELTTRYAPGWPAYRQPAVDRAIMRLAYHEMRTGYAPPKIAINEAIELAKRFCSQQSPAFVNGVLDRVAQHLREEGLLPASVASDTAQAPTPAEHPKPSHPDAWLRDAMSEADQPRTKTDPS